MVAENNQLHLLEGVQAALSLEVQSKEAPLSEVGGAIVGGPVVTAPL